MKSRILSGIISTLMMAFSLVNVSASADTINKDDYSLSDILIVKKNILNISNEEKDVNNDGSTDFLDLMILKNLLLKDIPEVESSSVVVYFSCTGNTEKVAKNIAEVTNSDIFEIVPSVPYTSDDLDYSNDSSRTSIEQNDINARPEISVTFENIDDYDTIYLGYPIWWGDAPKIMYTFVESYDFTDKTIVPFCTSGGSGISGSVDSLKKSCKGSAVWLDGKRFKGSETTTEISSWIDTLIK